MKHETRNKKEKILLTGGGTGGSVAPLLAITEALSPRPPLLIRRGGGQAERSGGEVDFLFVGTKYGLERRMVESKNIKFKSIASGKLRRYFSLKNLVDPFLILIGFLESIFIILKFKPDLIISAGSFVSVPVVWAGWILRVLIIIHQQDVRPGLANKMMAPLARVVTVTFEESLKDYGKKAVWTGNFSRNMKQEAGNIFNFKNYLSTVLVIGGGTGAMAINKLVWESMEELTKICNVIHITGNKKTQNSIPSTRDKTQNYNTYKFLNFEQMASAYTAADLVITRTGMGVLTELSNLGKAAILIPMPDSHQEDNADIFRKKEAAIVLNQKDLTPEKLIANIKKLLENKILLNKLSVNIKKVVKGGNEEIAIIINDILSS